MRKLVITDGKIYIYMILATFLLFLINIFTEYKGYISITSIIIGVTFIAYSYKKTKTIISPITIFCFIWFVLVGITSFSFPLMPTMTTEEWNITLLFIVSFCVGGCVISFVYKKIMGDKLCDEIKSNSFNISTFQYVMFVILILIGIIVHVYQTISFGGFVIFSDDPSSDRYSYSIGGLGSLSTFGTLGIFGCIISPKYRRKVLTIVLSFIYLFFLIVEGVRFQVFLTILLCLGVYSKTKIRLRTLIIGILLLLLSVWLFDFVANARQGASNTYRYYIQTGLYSGKVSEISSTEIFRYFGFSQRLTDYYWKYYKPGVSNMQYTLYPITHTFGLDSKLPDRIWVMGYVATSLIVYFYCDFGYFWPIATIVFSVLVNLSYYSYMKNNKSLIQLYFWSLSLFALTMSFYAYVNSYVYAILYFPIIILGINLINNSLQERNLLFYGYKN